MKMNFCRIMMGMALRYRDNVAIVNVERKRRFTYPEYHRLTNRIANAMRDTLGLGRGDNVLLVLDNDNLSLVHWPAILKQEATFAFSNQRDSPAEHARQIAYLSPKAVLIETRMLPAYSDMLTNAGCKIVIMDRVPDLPRTVCCFWDLLDHASDQDNDVELDTQNHIAVLRFSGGTSGRSKCAQYTVDNLLACRDNGFLNTDFHYGETTRFLTFTPISHAPSMIFIPTLFAGGTTYTLNTPDLVEWAQVVQAEQITHALFVPTLLYRMLEMQLAKTYDLSSLTTIGYGASPIAPSAVRGLIEAFGSIFVQGYGATETLQLVSLLGKQDHEIGSEAALKRLSR